MNNFLTEIKERLPSTLETRGSSYSKIKRLEQYLMTLPGAILGKDYPTIHRFCKDLYSREIEVPKGHLLVGKMHAKQNFFVMLTGEITIWTEIGMQRLKAPQVLVTQPGTKRVIYAHETCQMITFHGIGADTVEDAELIAFIDDKDEEAFLLFLDDITPDMLENVKDARTEDANERKQIGVERNR